MLRESPARSSPESLASGALTWTDAHLKEFDPCSATNLQAEHVRFKAAIELAVLTWRLRRHPGGSEDLRVQRFITFLATVYAQARLREQMLRADELFVARGHLWLALRGTGLIDDEQEHWGLQRALARGALERAERLSHRSLELRHLVETAGLEHRLPSARTLAARGILVRTPSALHATHQDAYSVTHALFYLSDWVARPIVDLGRRSMERTSRLVELLLGRYVYARDWDLVGELLLACASLRRTGSACYAAAWLAICDAQRPDGSVPAPPRSRIGDPTASLSADEDDPFARDYHPTLVAALAGTLCPPPITTDAN